MGLPTNKGSNWKEIERNWSEFIKDAMIAILEHRPALIYVYSSDASFSFGNINAKVWQRRASDSSNGTYFMASSNNWCKQDIAEQINSIEFELATLWFELNGALDEANVDPQAFFRDAANKIASGGQGVSKYECIGRVADGKEIIWENPVWNEEMSKMVLNLKLLCEQNGFDWNCNDNRNN